MTARILRRGAAFCVLLLALAGSAIAQGLFAPIVIVNDRLVTRYQVDQRVDFLSLLGLQENRREVALAQLTNEAIQLNAAEAAGVLPDEEAVAAGQSEFASRANLTREEFIAALAQGGVDEATFRDFIAAGVAWRAYVQDRFRPVAETFPPGSIERAVESAEIASERRVLLTEIILPANTPEAARVSRERARTFRQIRSAEEFGAAAREFSLANTRFRNGEVDWRLVSTLPPEVGAAIGNLQPGQTSRPVDLENAVAVFFVRDVEFTPATTSALAAVDYARLQLPPGSDGQASRIASQLDRCNDLFGFAGRYPEAAYQRETTLLNALPADLRAILATLDPGETSTALRRGGGPVVTILCGRTFGVGDALDLSQVRLGLVNTRLQLLANAHLADLRARSVIVRPSGG
ncbi:MAG: peptidylprolyl isomerase [Pseudomonadota bacterium]